mmetsp:Transcript_22754/g.36544  ORF Transcript_22754/g.36544 Transcript_22754/m.36544 type:complete len:201 (-) Transcript_22754:416-1018(-)
MMKDLDDDSARQHDSVHCHSFQLFPRSSISCSYVFIFTKFVLLIIFDDFVLPSTPGRSCDVVVPSIVVVILFSIHITDVKNCFVIFIVLVIAEQILIIFVDVVLNILHDSCDRPLSSFFLVILLSSITFCSCCSSVVTIVFNLRVIPSRRRFSGAFFVLYSDLVGAAIAFVINSLRLAISPSILLGTRCGPRATASSRLH